MSATARIRVHVEELFLDAPKSHRTIELKEELIANLQEKYEDLIVQGHESDEAYNIVVSSIGDIDELIRGLNERYILAPEAVDSRRKKSAMRIAIAVGLYIFSLVPLFFGISEDAVLGGLAFMVFIWAVATVIIIYNGIANPKYSKEQDNLIEDFKQFSSGKKKQKAVKGTIDSIVWTTATVIFLGGGIVTHRWNVVWLVFLLAGVACKIIDLLFLHMESDRD
jgi:heme/copper-type cytochrome/quinol oxidase subunit 4